MGTREEIIAGYRELLDFCEQHPELPLGRVELNNFCVLAGDDETGRAEIRRIASVLGAEPDLEGDQPEVCHTFGVVRYRAFYCTRKSMREYDFREKAGRKALDARRAAAVEPPAIDVAELHRSMAAAGLRVVAGPGPLRDVLPEALDRLSGGGLLASATPSVEEVPDA